VLTVITYAVLYTFNYLTVCEVSVEVSGKCMIEISDTSKEDIDSIYKSMWRTYITFHFLSHFWNIFTGSLFNLASFSNSSLLPSKLFFSGESSYQFPNFLFHPGPENSTHLVFTCCLFPGLKLRLVVFQLPSVLFGTHFLNMLSH